MSGWLAVLMWALAASALHLRGRRRLVRAARAGHEIRGPLCTAQLALEGLERSARVEAIGLELRRAALALDDLSGARDAPAGRPGGRRRAALRSRACVAGAGRRARRHARGRAGRRTSRRRPASPCPGLREPRRQRDRARAATQRGGLVHVRSSALDGRVRIEVRDGGPGLPAPVAELVAAARGRRSPRGHGLAIAAAVAERHGAGSSRCPPRSGAHLVLELPEAP